MLKLAMVCCGPELEVALTGDPLRGTSQVRLAGSSPRSTLLLAAVDLLFEDAGLSPQALDLVLVTRGPGSFTGIRAGLASALGLAEGGAVQAVAYDSLRVHAGRVSGSTQVWAAQPGRKGEVYARSFVVGPNRAPEPLGDIRILAVEQTGNFGPWVGPETLDLGECERAGTSLFAAEALLRLHDLGVESQELTPLYVEGPPIRRSEA